MKIDIEDNTFDQRKYFSRVLMQQAKVLTAADSNERDDILLYYLRTLATDLIGSHGGPAAKPGFEISLDMSTKGALTDLEIGRGRYYVDGILCENDRVDREGKEVEVTYLTQPDYPLPSGETGLPDNFLAYLDVWERHITAIEDPDIREVALGGPDTAARARVVSQVKITDKMPDGSDITNETTKDTVEHCWDQWVKKWQPTNRGKLKAKAKEDPDKDTDPCIISPEARYRGVENQLYRVEIHGSGAATQHEATGYEQRGSTNGDVATFKWSRDNGSVVFPIRDLDDNLVTLEHLGRDSRLSLKVGDWVEIVDDDYVLQGRAESLLRIEAIDPLDMRVTLSEKPLPGVGGDPAKHPLLRRWDHGAGDSGKGEPEPETGTLLVEEGAWLELEDGVQIYFQPVIKEYTIQYGDTLWGIAQRFGTTVDELQRLNDISDPDFIRADDILEVPVYHKYRTGDYWLIPARTATGDVEWLGDVGEPEARTPHGVEHHYCPLALIKDTEIEDCRPTFLPLTIPAKWPAVTGINWNNDKPMLLSKFNEGLEVTFSESMDPATVTLDTFIVTLELPVPDSNQGNPRFRGYRPLIVHGTVTPKSNDNSIWTFKPQPIIGDSILTEWMAGWPGGRPGFTCRVVLKGKAILSEKYGRPLDGDVFAQLRDPDPGTGKPTTNLILPSGDGNKGGDFESWFWLSFPSKKAGPPPP